MNQQNLSFYSLFVTKPRLNLQVTSALNDSWSICNYRPQLLQERLYYLERGHGKMSFSQGCRKAYLFHG
jgi:hypothetical protein